MGALTNKPFSFTARSFELKHTESVDVSDALGAAIRVDSRGPEVMRIVPRQNDAVNEDWISDKARFQCDGLRRQRLGVPMARGASGKLEAVSWLQALQAIEKAVKPLKGSEMKAIAGTRFLPHTSCCGPHIYVIACNLCRETAQCSSFVEPYACAVVCTTTTNVES